MHSSLQTGRDTLTGLCLAWSNLHARPELIDTLRDDHFTCGQSAIDCGDIVFDWPNRDVPHFDGVVFLDAENKRTLRPSLDSSSRYNHGAAFRIQQQPGIHKLTRKKRVVAVRKDGFETDGSRIRVDLVINREQRPAGDFVFRVPVECVDAKLGPSSHLLHDRGKTVFLDAEDDGDRL